MSYHLKQYCKDYQNIENYEKALADNFVGWECHHRLQTWTSDGERRLVDITADELKALDMYYNRPAEELVFLTTTEHSSLHKKGKQFSEEHKTKLSDSWDYDKHFTANILNEMNNTIKQKIPNYKQNPHIQQCEGISVTILSLIDANPTTQNAWDEIMKILKDI